MFNMWNDRSVFDQIQNGCLQRNANHHQPCARQILQDKVKSASTFLELLDAFSPLLRVSLQLLPLFFALIPAQAWFLTTALLLSFASRVLLLVFSWNKINISCCRSDLQSFLRKCNNLEEVILPFNIWNG